MPGGDRVRSRSSHDDHGRELRELHGLGADVLCCEERQREPVCMC